jgi:drug/metabolite transporter (DMT)-like permease
MKPTASLTMGSTEWLLLVALSVLWGGTFFFVEVALRELPPLVIVLGRVGMAAIALNILVVASGRRMPTTALAWRQFMTMGLLNNAIPFSLIFWGQTQITGGLAAILNATTPLFTAVLAHALTRDEKLTPGRLAGVVLGLAGVAVMIGVDALAGLGSFILAQVAVIGAAVSYSFAGIYGRRFKGTPPVVTAAGQVTCSSALMLPLVIVVEQPWTLAPPSWATWSAVVGLALLSTALAYIIFFRILAVAGATNLLLVTLLIPVSAILLGALFLGEQVELQEIAGMALIAAGLAFIDGRLPRFLMARRRGKAT